MPCAKAKAQSSGVAGRQRGSIALIWILLFLATGRGAQSQPSGDSVLLSVYRQYLMAIETHDLDKLQALTVDGPGKQQLAKLKQGMDEKQQSAMLDLLGKTQPESVELVNEKIVGDRGLLAIQGYSRGDLFARKVDPSQVPKGFRLANNQPIKKRQYELLRFKKVGGEWKLYRTKSFTYNDPRPYWNRSRARTSRNRNIRGSGSTAIFSQENVVPGKPPFQWMNESAHWSCFAQLRRKASLGDRIGSLVPAEQKAVFAENTKVEQTQCKLDVVELIGDPKICESIESSKILPDRKQQCLRKIEDYDFIPGLNIYTLDSDGDGLSDLQEIEFFNTRRQQSRYRWRR
jgi:hypothetical protein